MMEALGAQITQDAMHVTDSHTLEHQFTETGEGVIAHAVAGQEEVLAGNRRRPQC